MTNADQSADLYKDSGFINLFFVNILYSSFVDGKPKLSILTLVDGSHCGEPELSRVLSGAQGSFLKVRDGRVDCMKASKSILTAIGG